MATIDLTLDSFKVPAIENYTPPFGTKIVKTDANKGGLSTVEVNNNIIMPFANMRPKLVSENSDTTDIEYDAKLVFSSGLQAAVTLGLGNATYEGCELLVKNHSVYDCTVSKGTWSYVVPAGGYVKLEWNGSAWSEDVSSAVRSAIDETQSYSTEETLTGGTWIDGKPIYRRVWTGTFTTGIHTDILSAGLMMISVTGFVQYPQDNGVRYWIVNAPQNSSSLVYFPEAWYNSNGNVRFNVQGPFDGFDCVIIFEYTKPTD